MSKTKSKKYSKCNGNKVNTEKKEVNQPRYNPKYLNRKNSKKNKVFSKGKKIAFGFVVLLFVIIAGVITYINVQDVFPEGTTINNVDVSGLDEKRSEKALVDEWRKKEIEILEAGNPVGKISDFDMEYSIKNKVKNTLNPGIINKTIRLFVPSKRKYTIPMTVSKTNKRFESQFNNLSIVKNNKTTIETKDAYVDLETKYFKVVSEVYGDNLDKEALKKSILKSIAKGDKTFNYVRDKYYREPKIKKDSKEIKDKLDYAKKYLSLDIELVGNNNSYTLKPNEINALISVDKYEKVSVEKENCKKYLKEISGKFTNVGIIRHLSMPGGEITISGGNYGNKIDIDKTAKKLVAALKSNAGQKVEVVFENNSVSTSHSVGKSYVEVSLGKQHVWCVYNGSIVVSTDVVTGNFNEGNGTPTGVYALTYKTSPSTLSGRNNDGSEYKTKVNYWMPFNGDVGFHDAPWRNAFGSTIYKTNGSHGCVNMPPEKAALLYKYVNSGMAIVVHD